MPPNPGPRGPNVSTAPGARPARYASPDDLRSAAGLERLLGPVAELSSAPLVSGGLSGSRHERLRLTLRSGTVRHLVLKLTTLGSDWLACRSGDTRGREAALLDEPALDFAWAAFENPYLAHACDGVTQALLLEDLGPWLAPHAGEPLDAALEASLIAALAEMHALSWNAPALDLPWLMPAWRYFDLLPPGLGHAPGDAGSPPRELRDRVIRGWNAALPRLTAGVRERLLRPARELEAEWAGLPRTLIHGDAKLANFAFPPGRGVCAFDWSLVGAGPPTLDLGWYLAANAGRLSRTKDELLAEYRAALERRLGTPFPEAQWRRLVDVAIAVGARSLLWEMASGLDSGAPRARLEWDWWTSMLERAGAG